MLEISARVEAKNEELNKIGRRMTETNQVASECWKIASFRSLVEGGNLLAPIVGHITRYAGLINEIKCGKRRFEDFNEPDLREWRLPTQP